MKTKLKTRSQSRPAELIVYMEVCAKNCVSSSMPAIAAVGIRQTPAESR